MNEARDEKAVPVATTISVSRVTMCRVDVNRNT